MKDNGERTRIVSVSMAVSPVRCGAFMICGLSIAQYQRLSAMKSKSSGEHVEAAPDAVVW